MYLIAQDQDGTQTAATLNDIRSYGELEARAVAHYGGGRNLGKSAALGAPYGLPGSVRAGVRGWSAEESKRPTFTVDLGHNRR